MITDLRQRTAGPGTVQFFTAGGAIGTAGGGVTRDVLRFLLGAPPGEGGYLLLPRHRARRVLARLRSQVALLTFWTAVDVIFTANGLERHDGMEDIMSEVHTS